MVLEVGMYCDLREVLGENMVKLLGSVPTGKQFLHRRIYFPATTTVNRSAETLFGVRPFSRGHRKAKKRETDQGDDWGLRWNCGV